MKPVFGTLLIALLFASTIALAQTPRSRYDPAPVRGTGGQKGFVEFVFSRINPHNIDYGMLIEEFRASILDTTVRDVSFWADAFAAGLLILSFGIIVWQNRRIQGMRFSTARILTGYHCELTEARNYIATLSTEYKQMKRAADEQKEDSLSAKPQLPKRDGGPAASNKDRVLPSEPSPAERKLREDNERLKEEVAHSGRTVGNLRQQLSALTRRLEEEQQKSRKLRGE